MDINMVQTGSKSRFILYKGITAHPPVLLKFAPCWIEGRLAKEKKVNSGHAAPMAQKQFIPVVSLQQLIVCKQFG